MKRDEIDKLADGALLACGTRREVSAIRAAIVKALEAQKQDTLALLRVKWDMEETGPKREAIAACAESIRSWPVEE